MKKPRTPGDERTVPPASASSTHGFDVAIFELIVQLDSDGSP